MSDYAKFGPPPEAHAKHVLVCHFLLCVFILWSVRPPFVTDEQRTRYSLVVVIALILTAAVAQRSRSNNSVSF